MNKVKKWIPPVAPGNNDLPSWKAICNDIHANLLDAGLVQTEDTGQLDIDAVAELPGQGQYAGYRVYRWDDAAQGSSPIYMKIQFGVGSIGTNNNNTLPHMPRFITEFGTGTDGAGGGLLAPSTHMQTFNNTGSGSISDFSLSPGSSCYSRNDDVGFFGFVYASGAVQRTNGYYIRTGLMCFFVQRDSNGGFSIIAPANTWGGTNPSSYRFVQYGPYYTFIDGEGATPSVRSAANRPLDIPIFNPTDSINFAPVYATDSQRNIKQWPSLVTYHSDFMTAGAEFDLEIVQGETKTFIALGDEVGIGADQTVRGDGSFAMIWEDDG